MNPAKKLLTFTLKGLADALINKSDKSAEWVRAIRNYDSKEKLVEVREPFASLLGDMTIKIPKRKGNTKPGRKVTFAPAFGSDTGDGHTAPDPLQGRGKLVQVLQRALVGGRRTRRQ